MILSLQINCRHTPNNKRGATTAIFWGFKWVFGDGLVVGIVRLECRLGPEPPYPVPTPFSTNLVMDACGIEGEANTR